MGLNTSYLIGSDPWSVHVHRAPTGGTVRYDAVSVNWHCHSGTRGGVDTRFRFVFHAVADYMLTRVCDWLLQMAQWMELLRLNLLQGELGQFYDRKFPRHIRHCLCLFIESQDWWESRRKNILQQLQTRTWNTRISGSLYRGGPRYMQNNIVVIVV